MGGGVGVSTAKGWVREAAITEPNEADYEKYDAVYGQFKALYGDLADRFDAVASLR
jgi:hypothetical protein